MPGSETLAPSPNLGSITARSRASLLVRPRANPFPDATIVANAQALERLGREVGALEGLIRDQPVPENDRMTQRYRQEAATLAALAEKDAVLAGQAELLRSMLEGVAGDAMLMGRREIEEGIGDHGDAAREADVFTVRVAGGCRPSCLTVDTKRAISPSRGLAVSSHVTNNTSALAA